MKITKHSPDDHTLRYLILFGLLGSLFLHSFIKYGLLNQVVGFLMTPAYSQVPLVKSPNGFIPDWSRLRFQDMIIYSDGSVTYQATRGRETRTWKAGQSIAEFMELGDFETPHLAIEKLNLSTISQTQNLSLSRLKLIDFEPTKWQTLPDLVNAIPTLRNRSITSVKPLGDFLNKFGIANGTIGNASTNPRLQNIPLMRVINLQNYSLTSIPNIQNTAINRFANWQNSKVNGVPGLDTLTWDYFPGLRTLDLNFVGKVDIVFRDVEANRTRSISGSYQQGFNVPCLQNNCAHAEMSGVGSTTGLQWISGKVQKVRGGFGILQSLNRGQEPTGRHPFGSAFKQVIWDIDEASGSLETAMFFRICKTIPFIGRTCSPFFIGPVPFIEYKEKDPIIFGQPSTLPD
ncbi:hypothetical protein H6G76_25800 [Nostoc sp. FACHB-152]|uniref:hypothetical protein n=1 Tax=Nostoc sp. FACHB-152 TaxID=2692837 RepID=UPI00168346BC|nr:hypothetical protein [Nostoc sp. FACHB-152]MBD2450505.1 hypothetical protein [Nostoc sp. FACHB-152]